MDTALPKKIPFILDRNSAKANCIGNQVYTSCDIVVLGCYPSIFISTTQFSQIFNFFFFIHKMKQYVCRILCENFIQHHSLGVVLLPLFSRMLGVPVFASGCLQVIFVFTRYSTLAFLIPTLGFSRPDPRFFLAQPSGFGPRVWPLGLRARPLGFLSRLSGFSLPVPLGFLGMTLGFSVFFFWSLLGGFGFLKVFVVASNLPCSPLHVFFMASFPLTVLASVGASLAFLHLLTAGCCRGASSSWGTFDFLKEGYSDYLCEAVVWTIICWL